MRSPIAALFLLLLLDQAMAAPKRLLVNGDFESPAEEGWIYRGVNDGSNGVFSEPSRPGGHVFLLQLDGHGQPGESSIRQTTTLIPGKTYRLTVDVFDSCEPREPGGSGQVVAMVDGLHAFSHDLARGNPVAGWFQRRAAFRAERPETEIAFELSGSLVSREESTVLIDNVTLEEVDLELPLPLLRGKPLAPVLKRQFVPTAISYGENGVSLSGYEVMDRFRALSGRYPAYCEWRGGWDLADGPAAAFARTKRAVGAWSKLGTVPIVALETPASAFEAILAGTHDAYFKAWAKQAVEWGYPMVLRPWPEMDLAGRDYGQVKAGPKRFIEMWRRIHGLFAEEGARNVFWFWTPSTLSKETEAYYPGDEMADILGCSCYPKKEEGLTALDGSYQYHLRRHSNKAFAVAEGASVTGDQADWIGSLYSHAITQYPRMEFYTQANFDNSGFGGRDDRIECSEAGIAAYRRMRDVGILQNRLIQYAPPLVEVAISKETDSVSAVVTSLGGPFVLPSAKLKVEFWAGDPSAADQGTSKVGPQRWVTLAPGESRTFRQSWKEAGDKSVYVLVDRSVDPHYLADIPDPGDVLVFPGPKVQTNP